jgi:hypothetical protein
MRVNVDVVVITMSSIYHNLASGSSDGRESVMQSQACERVRPG